MSASVSLLLTWMSVGWQSGQIDKKLLRELLPMPQLAFELTIEFHSNQGYVTSEDKLRAPKVIDGIRQELTRNPSDARRWQRLGILLRTRGDVVGAKAASGKAAALLRERVKNKPLDARLMAELGAALDNAETEDEAERILRRAVKIGPHEWAAWSNSS